MLNREVTEAGRLVEETMREMMAPWAGRHPIYKLMEYHLGWRDENLEPAALYAGKRSRGLLCILTCRAAGGDPALAAPLAAAVEWVHNLSLVFDDIQDRSPYRRGRPAVWLLWGQAQAINVGAAMQALVGAVLSHLAVAVPDPRLLGATVCLHETILRLAEGQYDDIAMTDATLPATGEAYLSMVGRKTGALLGAATWLGAVAAGAPPQQAEEYRAFGDAVGTAYQVLDDIRGIWPEPGADKPASDLECKKKTLPVLLVLQAAGREPELRRLRRRYWDRTPLTGAERHAWVGAMERLGVRERCLAVAAEYGDQAMAALRRAGGDPAYTELLANLAAGLLVPPVVQEAATGGTD